ncbi:MAG: replication initiation protein [Cyanobacteria bacterium P01_F01_bin.53]
MLQLKTYLERNTIKHPTALLHFRRQLTDFEQGILFLCVHIIAKTERDAGGFYYLNKSLVRAVMRQEGNHDYTRINEAVDRVSETKLKLNFWGEDRTFDDYEAPLIIGKATSKRRGTIAFEVHPRLEKVIKDPRVFARLNIHFIAALADVNRGYAFYALFRDAVNRSGDPEVLEETYDYWELRAYLGVNEDHYKDFKLFKRKVLKPLIDGVNDRTDLHLSYEPVKTGRKLTHLKFTVRRQSWQLQLFEAEHAARLVAELAKTFDGPVIERRSTVAEIDVGEDRARMALIDKCVKLGVTSKTVERALKKYGVDGVGEIIAHTEKRFAAMDKKGQEYSSKDYLAKMLNDGVGVKTPDERNKASIAKERAAERKAAREAAAEAEADLKALEERHRLHRHARTQELLKRLKPAELKEVVAAVSENIPLRPAAQAWDKIDRDPSRVGELGRSHFAVIGVRLAEVVLGRWGDPADMDIEAFKQAETEAA